MVDEDHSDLASVTGVDETRGIEHHYAAVQRQPGSGEHQTSGSEGNRYGKTGGHQKALTRLDCAVNRGRKISGGIASPHSSRHSQLTIQWLDRDLERFGRHAAETSGDCLPTSLATHAQARFLPKTAKRHR